jgi:hypothetical protein
MRQNQSRYGGTFFPPQNYTLCISVVRRRKGGPHDGSVVPSPFHCWHSSKLLWFTIRLPWLRPIQSDIDAVRVLEIDLTSKSWVMKVLNARGLRHSIDNAMRHNRTVAIENEGQLVDNSRTH